MDICLYEMGRKNAPNIQLNYELYTALIMRPDMDNVWLVEKSPWGALQHKFKDGERTKFLNTQDYESAPKQIFIHPIQEK